MLYSFLLKYNIEENSSTFKIYEKFHDEKIQNNLDAEGTIDDDFYLKYFKDFLSKSSQLTDLFSKLKKK
jgi:hypothetical protein